MTTNNSKYFFGSVLSAGMIVVGVALFVPFASARSESDDEGGQVQTEEQKLFWMKVRERAQEQKTRLEKNAVKNQAMVDGKNESRQERLCANLVEQNTKMSDRLGDRYDRLLERKTKRTDIFEENREKRDATLEAKRLERDFKRDEMYAKLLERAGDDADKKAAVMAFETTVEAAITTRKAAVDAAIAAFRSGVDAAIGTKKNTIDTAIDSYKEALEAAFAKAKSDCDAGVDSQTVRATLQSSLESARMAVVDDRQAAEKVGEQVRALAATKKASFDAAHTAFKSTMESARVDLKAAFASTGGESEAEGE